MEKNIVQTAADAFGRWQAGRDFWSSCRHELRGLDDCHRALSHEGRAESPSTPAPTGIWRPIDFTPNEGPPMANVSTSIDLEAPVQDEWNVTTDLNRVGLSMIAGARST